MASFEIDNAIAELTGLTGGAKTVRFLADIGNVGIDEIDWILLKNDDRRKVTLPRAVFTYERLGPRENRWNVSVAAAVAEEFGIQDFCHEWHE